MKNGITRRDCLRIMGISGLGIGTGSVIGKQLSPQDIGQSGFQSSVITTNEIQENRSNAVLIDGKVIQPQRQLPVLTETDVLVVGGGSAGIVAAIAARRAGAKVTIVERYGHFGGLWTGGLVLTILGHIAQGPKQVCQGIGEEIMRRLDKMDGAIINRSPGSNPIVDAEAVIKGETVVVQSASVPEPRAVRFGFSDMAEPNLFNKDGLPASPFRTDD